MGCSSNLKLNNVIIWGSTDPDRNYYSVSYVLHREEHLFRLENYTSRTDTVWIALNMQRAGDAIVFGKGSRQHASAHILSPPNDAGDRQKLKVSWEKSFTVERGAIVLLGITARGDIDVTKCLDIMAARVDGSSSPSDISLAQIPECTGCTIGYALVSDNLMARSPAPQ